MMKSNIRLRLGFAATLGISALLIGFTGLAPAHADDFDRYERNHIYRDVQDVRRDERILRDLEARRDEFRRCRNWDGVRALDRRISDLRCLIERDVVTFIGMWSVSATTEFAMRDIGTPGIVRTVI